MKSKWLGWKPSSETIDKTAHHGPSEPSKPGFDGFEGFNPVPFSIRRDFGLPAGRVYESQPLEPQTGIPAGVLLIAPRYSGDIRPLASVPKCWCCKISWKLHRLTESKGKAYAWLEPGCRCLDTPLAVACCGLCTEHCRCGKKDKKPQTQSNAVPKTSMHDFGLPIGEGDAR